MKNKISLGTWLTIPHQYILDILLTEKKIEWIVIDLEHTSISISDIEKFISIIHAKNKKVYIRISSHLSNEIKKTLDAGADGIIVPMVKNHLDIKNIINQSYFPPIGSRSFSFCKATDYGTNFKNYTANFNKKIKVIPLIEHINAVNNLNEILNDKKIDTIMIGPYDLSGSIGKSGDFENKNFINSLKKIDLICKKRKVKKGIHLPSINYANFKKLKKNNFKFIAYGMDTQFLLKSIRETFKKI